MWRAILLTVLFIVGWIDHPRAAETEACRRWSPQISGHLDWVCARTPGEVETAMRQPPSLASACQTMEEHVADLLNRHRRVDEMADADFAAALVMFQDGQSACGAQRFEEGLAIYASVPVRRVTSLLR